MNNLLLPLYSDWRVCSACGLEPKEGKKLLTCRNCKCVAYHDADCQKAHWKRQHKHDCKHWKEGLKPLMELSRELLKNPSSGWWWKQLSVHQHRHSDHLWQRACHQWYRQDYLVAMRGFQEALEPFQRAWECVDDDDPPIETGEGDGDDDDDRGICLAKRLLFCAYCELDGNQIERARHRIVQCLSIVVSLAKQQQQQQQQQKPRHQSLLNDAWMELCLSMEEVPRHRMLARHVASMAIATNACGWKDPLQRPGYMAKSLDGVSFLTRDRHPSWCHLLETHWESVLEEYQSLTKQSPHLWSGVGSGTRESGHDDHRVVVSSSGQGGDWKEYVLFGTGARENDVPFTKALLRNHVPDAVSLAEEGGGEVIFSRLAPHTHIQSHCGPTNLRWTAHLGLVIPAYGARIRVGTRWHTWQPGRVFMFDDSYEHEVRNDSNQERVVLLLRIWHPDLAAISQREHCLHEARARKEAAIEKRYHPPN